MTLIFAQTAWLIPLYPLLAAVLSLCWAPGGLGPHRAKALWLSQSPDGGGRLYP
jgi:hypothetical protein